MIGSARQTLTDYMPHIEIPQELYNQFVGRAKEKGFSSPGEYLLWVLREIALRLPESTKDKVTGHTPIYTPEQEAIVKDRLRSLGYID